jgi:hypothetical protein
MQPVRGTLVAGAAFRRWGRNTIMPPASPSTGVTMKKLFGLLGALSVCFILPITQANSSIVYDVNIGSSVTGFIETAGALVRYLT